jgi:CDP-paratose synthetase
MRVLLTGATGFFGSHLARTLVARGDEVHATRRASSSLARLGDAARAIQWHDVANPADPIVGAAMCDAVIHAATDYGRAGANASTVEWVNFTWPMALLHAAEAARVPLFVNVDTSLPPALSAYAGTKRSFAEHARERTAWGAIRVLNIGLESVFGPGDDSTKFQMTLLHALLRNEASYALTPGEQSRDYVYVDDAVDAAVRLVDHAVGSGVPYLHAGVGRGESVTIRRFAESMRAATGAATRLEFGALPYRPGELMEARADVSVLRAIGWPGARSLEAGIAEMVRRERGDA